MYKISYKKFEYSLNAMLYCIWLINIQEENFAGKVVDALFSPILKYLFTKEHKQIYYERISMNKKIVIILVVVLTFFVQVIYYVYYL